ncbi:hypothetical protein HC02_11000 [Vibrio parahaemolyticus]|nr:hypothetical protein HC02_11000 [Vibrio parahaemolyticus]
MHLIACSWLAYQSAMASKTSITEQMVKQGMLQMLNVVKPVATEQGLEQLQLLEEAVSTLQLIGHLLQYFESHSHFRVAP